jgi:hypothetical protein
MRLTHVSGIVVSGLIWMLVGFFLLSKGLNFIVLTTHLPLDSASLAWTGYLSSLSGGREEAALFLVCVGLLLGFIKGRFILAKTVNRIVKRILSLPLPLAWSRIYGRSYYILIGSMVLLGLSMKWINLPLDIRGTVDVFVGSALIHGALLYFRSAASVKKQSSS